MTHAHTAPRTRPPAARSPRPPARRASLLRDTRGAAYVEFLLVFIPVFTMFLAMVQASMMYTANLVVTHAANTAARAAVVVLDDDPKQYGDEERNQLPTSSSGGAIDAGDRFLEWLGLGAASGPATSGGSSGARRGAIRDAAGIPLLAVSPALSQIVGNESVYKAIGGNPAERAVTGAAAYNKAAVAVTFPSQPGANISEGSASEFEENGDVTVRVSYLFHCGVPLVNRLMCDPPPGSITVNVISDVLRSGTRSPEEILRIIERERNIADRRRRNEPGYAELEYVESRNARAVLGFTGARFAVLRSEATLPNHAANYEYHEE